MTHPRTICALTMLAACGVRGNGQEATESRQVGAFDAVENGMNIEVEIIGGEAAEVVITCDENLLDLIETDVVDGWLLIRTDIATNIRPKAPCYATITAPTIRGVAGSGSGETTARGVLSDLQEVHASGSGSVSAAGDLAALSQVTCSGSGGVTVDGVDHDGAIQLVASGSGAIDASGSADSATCTASGSGSIRARQLAVRDATIRVSGSGTVELTVTGQANATLSGSGDAILFGNPQVSEHTSGSGDVVIK